MKTQVQQKPNNHSSVQAKAKNQAQEGSILQAYKKGTAQLQAAPEEEEAVQAKFETAQLEELGEGDEEPAQRRENKTGLPDNLKSGVENLSGHSLDDVKVHYGSSKPAELQAHAYAQGTDIHVAPGQEKHLPHEAWHVAQQKQGRVKPTMQLKGTVPVNDDAGLEKEADVMGAKALNTVLGDPKQFKTQINESGVLQKKTEVEHTSIHQNYFSNDDISTQVMGVEMNASIDPWNPLHGTDTGAFTRHGIYKDDDYEDHDQHATAMHLLNANLGGLAIDENLFPGTTNKNGQHLKSGETEVKNKVLTLIELGKNDDSYKDWRVQYTVKFNPPSLIRPENWKDVKLQLGHSYMDENKQAVNQLTDVSEDPNKNLKQNNWTVNELKGRVQKGEKNYLHENVQGDRATFSQEITHNQDIDNGSTRTNKHLAHEDYKRD